MIVTEEEKKKQTKPSRILFALEPGIERLNKLKADYKKLYSARRRKVVKS